MSRIFRTYNKKQEEVHRCKIESQQCKQVKKDGNQCRKKTAMGLPYCYTHLRFEKKVLKKNNQLLAWSSDLSSETPVFPRRSVIFAYQGEILDEDDMTDRYQDTIPSHIFVATHTTTKEKLYLDTGCKRGISFYLGKSDSDNNCSFKITQSGSNIRIELIAKKAIYHGEQLIAKSSISWS